MNKIFENLNDKQIDAVMATEGKVRIVAGAGSGKTRVLAHRYAFLVNELGIDPGNILCMTFTNKAAQEMKIRISKLVHRAHVNDFVCTIHGFCVKFLRKEIYRIGYPQNFIIIDEEDSKLLVKQVMEEFELDTRDSTAKQILSDVGNYKIFNPYIEEVILPNSKISHENEDKALILRYIQLQQKNYMLDFQDLIYFSLYIMEHYEDSLSYWQQKMNYIMVDEAQDCSGVDWTIVNYLAEGYDNLFIVGDPDQCIYEWRGAKPDSFLNFPAETDIILNQNYRSTPNILDVANSIIVHNENRIPKDLFTKNTSSKIVLHYHGSSDSDEADWIAKQIDNMSKNGSGYNDFAILYRASYLSRAIEQALLLKQIKYVVWGGIRFFERREIKDILAYFRLIAYKQDDISFKRIINTPSRKFGKASLSKLQELANTENTSLYDTLRNHLKDDIFNKPAVADFVQLIEEWTDKHKHISVSDMFDRIFKDSGLEVMYRTEGDDERLENIAELKQSIREYELQNSEEEEISLETYLQDIALYTNADYKNDGATVKLMTIHQAKGLEFPYVFVCGMSEGIFPNHRTIRERKKNGEEEERRLMYVAVTRAEHGLFLTESEGYNSVTRSDKYPSRFLREVKEGLIEIEGNLTKEQMSELYDCTKQLIDDLENDINPMVFKKGDKVAHWVFGIGEIIEAASDASFKVRFDKGERFIQSNYLKPWDGTKTLEELFKRVKLSHHNTNVNPSQDKIETILHVGDIINHFRFGKGVIEKVWGKGKLEKALVTFGENVQTICVKYNDFSIQNSIQTTEYITESNIARIKNGSLVEDELFGIGEVKKIEVNEGQVQVGIDFVRTGYKDIPISLLKLRLLNDSEYNSIKKMDQYKFGLDVQEFKEQDMVENDFLGIGVILEKKSKTSYMVKFDSGIRVMAAGRLRQWKADSSSKIPRSPQSILSKDILKVDGKVFRVRDVVQHHRYGKGTIVDIIDNGDNRKVVVLFDNKENEVIFMKFDKLTILK